jgi:hypothetical protein
MVSKLVRGSYSFVDRRGLSSGEMSGKQVLSLIGERSQYLLIPVRGEYLMKFKKNFF